MKKFRLQILLIFWKQDWFKASHSESVLICWGWFEANSALSGNWQGIFFAGIQDIGKGDAAYVHIADIGHKNWLRKKMVFLVRCLSYVRRFKFLRSIFWVFAYPLDVWYEAYKPYNDSQEGRPWLNNPHSGQTISWQHVMWLIIKQTTDLTRYRHSQQPA